MEILERMPHDPEAFTQGLETAGRAIYESTGLYGQVIAAESGSVHRRTRIPDPHAR